MNINLKSLLTRLNTKCQSILLERALRLSASRGNYNIDVEHWVFEMLGMNDKEDLDWRRILKHYDVDLSKLSKQLSKSLDRLKGGNTKPPGLSQEIIQLTQKAWLLASVEYGAQKVRSGHLLVTLLTDEAFVRQVREEWPELAKIPGEQLQKEVRVLIAGSAEDEVESAPAASAQGDGTQQARPGSQTPSLDQFTTDLTDRARQKQIEPVIGREFEVRQIIDILTRRRQNNPILTGEAGVGKTAVVEGFAQAIADGNVPDVLKNAAVKTLDLGLLQAGAGMKGEFENRLKTVIQEVKASKTPIILFIDEAHTMIGAGGQAGQGDAANLLKPALARGELRTIAATTWMEYKKYFEGDPALKRRFQVVKVDEPDVERGVRMMRGMTHTLEKHHKVRVLEEAVTDAVKLSHRYITDRQLPDKSVSLLDTACAKVALSQSTLPSAIEDARREIDGLTVELNILKRETTVGLVHDERLAELEAKKVATQTTLKKLEERWDREKKLVKDIQEVQKKLEAAKGESPADMEKLKQLETELRKEQGEEPLVLPVVNSQAVAEVISGWTGIPVGKMVRDEIEAVIHLADRLKERVVGQDHALHVLAERIKTSRAGLTDPKRPIGVFMLVGPSGVGKTETALALADTLYGGDRNMVIINMSEYKESSKISNLTGSAKGLVGYGEPGALTDPVRRKPHCVVLLDEVEKAHTDVQELFYQVFDKGMLQDSSGNDINFKNTIILLTSNVGTDTIMKVCADPDTRPDMAGLAAALRPDLLKSFKPALLGRIAIVPYFPLGDEVIKTIITMNLRKVEQRMREGHKAAFTYDPSLVTTIAQRCKEVESGARNVEQIVTNTLLPEIAVQVLQRMVEEKPIKKVHVTVGAKGEFEYAVT